MVNTPTELNRKDVLCSACGQTITICNQCKKVLHLKDTIACLPDIKAGRINFLHFCLDCITPKDNIKKRGKRD